MILPLALSGAAVVGKRVRTIGGRGSAKAWTAPAWPAAGSPSATRSRSSVTTSGA